MYYVIQESLVREYRYKALIEHLNKMRERKGDDCEPLYSPEDNHEIVKYIPFSEQLEVKTERKDVFFFGSSNAGMIAKKKYDWQPGHFINENFTMKKYLPAFGEHMLNSDGLIAETEKFADIASDPSQEFFIRPLGDGKEFTGQLFSKLEFEGYIKDNNTLLEKCPKVLVASPKTTQQEIRCWIIDGEPATISQYKIGSRGNYLNMDHNDEAIIFARKMSKIFQPARAYCLDICLYNDEYYIVELGCINHCGFYDANMGKLIDALEKMKF